MIDNLKHGYRCKCGKWHIFPMYYFAHYAEEITHECDCGRKNILQNGNLVEEYANDK